MTRRNWHFALGLLVVSFCLTSSASSRSETKAVQGTAAQATPTRAVGSGRLAQIADEYWQNVVKDDLYQRLRTGAPVDALPDLSEKRSAADAAFAGHILSELAEIKPDSLNHEDLLTLRILQWQEQQNIESAKYYWFSFPITPYISPLSLVQRAYTEHRFRNKADLDHYLALLEKYPPFINQIETHLRGQLQHGIVLPQDEIPVAKAFLAAYLQEPENSALFVKTERLSKLDRATIQPFQEKVAQIIKAKINPTLRTLSDYVTGDYAKKAPAAVGVGQYPGGKDYYRFALRNYVTLKVTPEEVHRIGVESVEKGEARMAELRSQMGFKGTREEFNHFLKTDPRFFPKTPEEIETKLMSYVSRVQKVVGNFFVLMPKAPYGVKRLDPALEGGQTFGFYDQPSATQPMGIYYFNGSNLSERSLLDAGPLILHELIPGHHFQINLQAENQTLPEFRRQFSPGAYTEGWGDYSAKLGQDMGIYQDPYDQYALLAMDMFISVRLVVDTGMNYLGWSRDRALEFMRQHDLETEMQLRSESLRYSVDMPGQALCYKMGSLELIKMREKAKAAAGNQFDIRKFHACVLGSGSMPLDILADHVNWCMKQPPEQQHARN
jgi:uncharacterized protein (DUF885 family)